MDFYDAEITIDETFSLLYRNSIKRSVKICFVKSLENFEAVMALFS